MTNEEVSQVLGISLSTVKNYWKFSRAWLLNEMEGRQQLYLISYNFTNAGAPPEGGSIRDGGVQVDIRDRVN